MKQPNQKENKTMAKNTARKLTKEEQDAIENREREIFYLQGKMGLTIAKRIASEVFGGEPSADEVLEVYDLLKTDDDGEYREDQSRLVIELRDAKAIAVELFGNNGEAGSVVLEVYDRLRGSFDIEGDDEE